VRKNLPYEEERALFAPTLTPFELRDLVREDTTSKSSASKPVPMKARTCLNTWLSVLGDLLSAEGRRAMRRRKGRRGVRREGSSWMRRAWRAARMVV
jgi:hypothetical protein